MPLFNHHSLREALSRGTEMTLRLRVTPWKASSVPKSPPLTAFPLKARRAGAVGPTQGPLGPLGSSPRSPAPVRFKGAAVSSGVSAAGPKPCQLEQALFPHQTQTNPEVRGKSDKIHCFGPLQKLATRASKRSSEIRPCLRAIKTRSHM